MNKPAIFAAIAVVIIGAIAMLAASTASVPSVPSFGAQIDSLPMATHAHGLPVQRIEDFSVVFAEPVSPTAVALAGASGEQDVTRALLDRR